MTSLLQTRLALLDEYIKLTQGKVIDPYGPNAPSAPALAQHYLQFMTGHPLPHIPGDAFQWAGKEAGRILAGLTPHPRTGSRPEPWATFTPSPLVNPRAHKMELWPTPGDLMVFDRNARQGNPWGTVGIHVEQDFNPDVWAVYSQGFGPPAVLTIDASYLKPLGWWHICDTHIRNRPKAPQSASVQ